MELPPGSPDMVLRALYFALLLGLGSALAVPAGAHKEHDKQKVEQVPAETMIHTMSPQVHEAVKDDLARMEVQQDLPLHLRLLDWVGRVHPFAVHFPLALFPISWIALVLARRRGDAEPLLRSLIIVAGASAAVAGALGWLNGGLSLIDDDLLMAWHRWLGTALGAVGAAVALWSWRHRSAAHSKAMVWLLGVTTALLMAQGWLGGALVHGADHLNW